MSELVAAFSRVRDGDPSRPLLHVPALDRSLTAEEIWAQHARYAERLRASGVSPGHLVLLAVGNRPAVAGLLLAVHALGAAAVAVDSGTPAVELAALAERFDVRAFVLPSTTGLHVDGARTSLDDDLVVIVREAAARYVDVALLKLTSGSTGLPKATCTSERQLVADSEQIVQGMSIGPDDTQIAVIPLSHAYGLSVILMPLLLQGTPMILRESFVPQALPADAREYRARTFPGVPFMFEYFVANPPPDGWPHGLRTLISAGARLPPETVTGFFDRFGVKIHSFYGASETGGITYDAGDEVDGSGTVGRPLPGVTITFHPDPDTPAGTGRVHVRSAGVAYGYLGERADEFCDDGFLTGDYGSFDSTGRLMLTGRVSSFINVAGRKVQPAEVEAVLRGMPGVRDVRVVGAPDRQRGEQVVACLAVDGSAAEPVTPLAVRRFCSSRLAPHKIPRTVLTLDAIPLTPRGKTDRRALEEAIRLRIAGIPEQMC